MFSNFIITHLCNICHSKIFTKYLEIVNDLTFYIRKCLTSAYPFCYNGGMDFKLNELKTEISVPQIANVHFFDFPEGYETKWNSHPFRELLFVANGKISVSSEEYTGVLEKNDCIVHGINQKHTFACHDHSETAVVVIGFECASGRLDCF